MLIDLECLENRTSERFLLTGSTYVVEKSIPTSEVSDLYQDRMILELWGNNFVTYN